MKKAQKYTISVTACTPEEQKYSPVQRFGLIVEEKTEHSNNYTEIHYFTVRNKSTAEFNGVLHFELFFESTNPRYFMPAFLYNRNRGDAPSYYDRSGFTAAFPKLGKDDNQKNVSNYWMVRADRLSHPVSIVHTGDEILGISAEPYDYIKHAFRGFSCKMEQGRGSIGYTIGYENAPYVYVDLKTMDLADKCQVTLKPEEEISVKVITYCIKSTDPGDINVIIRDVYRRFHENPRQISSISEAAEAISNAIFRDAYAEKIRNYSTRVFLKSGKAVQEPLASISWTGGVETAVPLLLCAARLGRQDMRNQAVSVVKNIVEHSLNQSSGLPYDAYDGMKWNVKGWWDDCLSQSGHSSYLVGQALYYIVKAYEIEKDFFQVKHSHWLEFVKKCLEKVQSTQNDEGTVPYLWSENEGAALDYDGMAGCWCIAAALYYERITADNIFLENSKRGLLYYYEQHVKQMECYGTPHDTYKAVDSEGVLAFIKSARYLHEITEEAMWLNMLRAGLEYEFTFKFCWNPPVEFDPLKRLGWSCCGGSVTSTCNPHIHPMSNNIMDEMYYYWKLSGDSYILSRLKDAKDWALQTYSMYDGEYDYGRKGWMSERFCYCQGLLTEQYEDGSKCSTWRCFLPWGASNILEGLCGKSWENQQIFIDDKKEQI